MKRQSAADPRGKVGSSVSVKLDFTYNPSGYKQVSFLNGCRRLTCQCRLPQPYSWCHHCDGQPGPHSCDPPLESSAVPTGTSPRREQRCPHGNPALSFCLAPFLMIICKGAAGFVFNLLDLKPQVICQGRSVCSVTLALLSARAPAL